MAAEPYLLLDLPISRDYFTSLFLTEGIQSRPAARLTDIALVRSMVGNGFGYSLVNLFPVGSTTLDGSRVAYVPVISKLPALQLCLAMRLDEHDVRPLADLVEHAHEFAATSLRQGR